MTLISYKSAKYRTITFSLIVRPLFTPLLPSNPIYHQLSHRECFKLLVSWIFVHMIVMQRTYSAMEVVQKSCSQTLYIAVYSLSIIGNTVQSSGHTHPLSRPRPLISLQSPHTWIILIEGRYGWSSETEK